MSATTLHSCVLTNDQIRCVCVCESIGSLYANSITGIAGYSLQ